MSKSDLLVQTGYKKKRPLLKDLQKYTRQELIDFLEYVKLPKKKNPISKKWKVSRVQSLVFNQKYFTKSQAKNWAKRHGYCYGHVEKTANTWRLRQIPKESIKKGKFRAFLITTGL